MEQDYNLKKWTKPCPKVSCKKSCSGLRYVVIPAVLGDDSEDSGVAPKNGAYCNAIVKYEANESIYFYTAEGVPVSMGKDFGPDIEALGRAIEAVIADLSAEAEVRELADAALEGSINNLTVDLEEETAARISADEALQTNITAEATARANADTALGNRVTAIEEKIPTQASAQNQLADKNFVNSSVATNTANYISDNGQPFTSLAALEAYSGTLTNNDYAFVVGTDQQGNTTYTRYKYVASTSSWAEEYVLNNSSFTANQWAAINSGITSGDVSKLAGLANIQTIGANLTLTNGELSATDTTYTAGSNVQISAQNVISATDTTYTAGTGLDLTGTQFSIDNTVALKSEIPTKTSDLTNDSDFVTNTDYATTSTGGVIKTSTNYGNQLTSNGVLAGASKTYAAYQSSPDTMLVSKNCLENVIDGKGLVDQTDLATKQDTLTAGSNVQINNNVISATDTTYSDFTGATSSTAGTNGLVPAPLAGDEGKFLSGNGQWTTVSQYALPIASATDLGGIKVGANLTIDSTTGVLSADAQQITPVQATGTSTTDVMSQNATTSMVFADPSTKRMVQIGDGASASGSNAVAVGPYSSASTNSVGIGYNTESTGTHAVAIGAGTYGAKASGASSIALGAETWATGQSSIAIGTGLRNNTAKGSIAIGFGSVASSVGEMNIGSSSTSYGYNSSNYRLLTGLYDPQSAHDAATKGYVDTSITTAISGITGVQFEVVQTLPATGDAGTIYLVPNSGTTPNIYDEYIYVNNSFEKIGTTEIDLSNYVTNTDYASSSTGGVIKTSTTTGTGISTGGVLYATNSSYATYSSSGNNFVISKGTLENVITGKGLVDQTDLATKQDVLTAGTGISINNNVISATGGVSPLTITLTPDQQYEDEYTWSGATIAEIEVAFNAGATILLDVTGYAIITVTNAAFLPYDGQGQSMASLMVNAGGTVDEVTLFPDGSCRAYEYTLATTNQVEAKASITLSTTDIGEGATLAENTLYGVYE